MFTEGRKRLVRVSKLINTIGVSRPIKRGYPEEHRDLSDILKRHRRNWRNRIEVYRPHGKGDIEYPGSLRPHKVTYFILIIAGWICMKTLKDFIN